MAKKTHAQQIAERCIKEAKDTLGAGWNHVSVDIQWGLVSARILYVYLGQDEDTDPKAVAQYIQEVTSHASSIVRPNE